MKQKINIRLSLIAFIAVIFSAVSITLVYYNLFQNQVRADLQINARIISDCRIFQRSHEATGGDAECVALQLEVDEARVDQRAIPQVCSVDQCVAG